MSKSYYGEIIERMEMYKEGAFIYGIDPDISAIIRSLSREIKDIYPMNKVPECILQSFEELKESFAMAEYMLARTLDILIYEIKKIDGLQNV